MKKKIVANINGFLRSGISKGSCESLGQSVYWFIKLTADPIVVRGYPYRTLIAKGEEGVGEKITFVKRGEGEKEKLTIS